MRALIAMLACGCYKPSIVNCQYSCATGDLCPGGLVCDQGNCVHEIGEPCAPIPDGAPQDHLPGEAGCGFGYMVSNVNPCQFTGPAGDWIVLTSNTTMINTDDGTIVGDAPPAGAVHMTIEMEGGGLPVMVIYVNQFDLGRDATFNVIGTLPLIILADDHVGIDGVIDFSKTSVAGTADCRGLRGENGVSTGGGGGGGSLGIVTIFSNGAGANGGMGGTGSQRGFAGMPIADTSLVPLITGCTGGQGGLLGASFGGGGGAIQISSRSTITVLGQLRANGGGAAGNADKTGGGGGGGSGGEILLEGTTITLLQTSVLCANGGGGGAAGTTTRGQDGQCSLTVAHGAGTAGAPGSGGDGETATFGAVIGQDGSLSIGNGGGGGGGGVGIIHINGNPDIRSGSIQTPHLQ